MRNGRQLEKRQHQDSTSNFDLKGYLSPRFVYQGQVKRNLQSWVDQNAPGNLAAVILATLQDA